MATNSLKKLDNMHNGRNAFHMREKRGNSENSVFYREKGLIETTDNNLDKFIKLCLKITRENGYLDASLIYSRLNSKSRNNLLHNDFSDFVSKAKKIKRFEDIMASLLESKYKLRHTKTPTYEVCLTYQGREVKLKITMPQLNKKYGKGNEKDLRQRRLLVAGFALYLKGELIV